MGRVERYRTARQSRWKYLGSFVIFFVLLISGICTVDYAVNSISKNVNRVELITVKDFDSTFYEVNIANKRFYINTVYIKRDYQNFKNKIHDLLNGK